MTYQSTYLDRAEGEAYKAPVRAGALSSSHKFTFAATFLFVVVLYFKPTDYVPGFPAALPIAQWVAIAAILTFLATQLVAKSPIEFTIETKCAFFLLIWAVLTMPLAYDRQLSLDLWWDVFFKVVVIFFICVNCLKTRGRIKWLMWLGIALGVTLGYEAISAYSQGIFKTEGYRVRVEHHVFGGTNDMALHFLIYTPIAFVLALNSKNVVLKILYFAAALIMVFGIFVSQSRGASLGLVVVAFLLIKKLGRGQRAKSLVIATALIVFLLALAPGNFAIRMLSIFDSSLDPVGSSMARSDLLVQSIWVTLRNPLGVGMGNSVFFGIGGKETHNGYTQISSELGWLALAAYLTMIIKPLRRLSGLQRRASERPEAKWDYNLAVGLHASLAGYMVGSFFGSVAYLWYMYFPIAVAIALEKIYSSEYEPETLTPEAAKAPLPG